MTKERMIEILKDLLIQLSDSANILCTCEADERCEVVEECIKALEQNTVSQETYDSEYLARKQAEHELYEIQQNTSDDCVSRKAVLDTLMKYEKPCDDRQDFYLDSTTEFEEEIKEIPPVTPTHGTCKDCKHIYCEHHEETCDINEYDPNFYCKDYKKRGNEK